MQLDPSSFYQHIRDLARRGATAEDLYSLLKERVSAAAGADFGPSLAVTSAWGSGCGSDGALIWAAELETCILRLQADFLARVENKRILVIHPVSAHVFNAISARTPRDSVYVLHRHTSMLRPHEGASIGPETLAHMLSWNPEVLLFGALRQNSAALVSALSALALRIYPTADALVVDHMVREIAMEMVEASGFHWWPEL